MDPMLIASIVHEANRQYCQTLGDDSNLDWESAPQQQRDRIYTGVLWRLANPTAPPSDSHANWLAFMQDHGWTYGPVKNEALKQHPSVLPYDELPASDKRKVRLFYGIIDALTADVS